MPRALSICPATGCPNTKPCPVHVRKPWSGRGSRHERGYGSEWDRLRRLILERDNHTCYRCGAHARTVDHITPKYQGGTDDPSNLAACCSDCQKKKAAREGHDARRARGAAR